MGRVGGRSGFCLSVSAYRACRTVLESTPLATLSRKLSNKQVRGVQSECPPLESREKSSGS